MIFDWSRELCRMLQIMIGEVITVIVKIFVVAAFFKRAVVVSHACCIDVDESVDGGVVKLSTLLW